MVTSPGSPWFGFLLFHPHPSSDAAFSLDSPDAACPGVMPAPSQKLGLSIVNSYPKLVLFLTQPCSTVRSRGRRKDWRVLKGRVRKRGDFFWEPGESTQQDLPKARSSPVSLSCLLETLCEISSLISCLITTKSSNEPDLSGLMFIEKTIGMQAFSLFSMFFCRNNFHVYSYIHRQQWQLNHHFRKFISSAIISKNTKLSSGK